MEKFLERHPEIESLFVGHYKVDVPPAVENLERHPAVGAFTIMHPRNSLEQFLERHPEIKSAFVGEYKVDVPPTVENPPAVMKKEAKTTTTARPAGAAAYLKTRPCKFFERAGYCDYGPKCKFAHGTHELRTSPAFPTRPVLPVVIRAAAHTPPVVNRLPKQQHPKFTDPDRFYSLRYDATCPFISQRRCCMDGDYCPYVHADAERTWPDVRWRPVPDGDREDDNRKMRGGKSRR